MLHVSDNDNESDHPHAAYVYHPQSDALENKVKQIVARELGLFGLNSKDYHQIHIDMEFVRELRQARKRTLAIASKAILLGLLSLIGSLLMAGITAMLGKGQP